jgi:hypothetical protein
MVLLMWALFRLEKEEREPSDSFENGKGIILIKDGLNHTPPVVCPASSSSCTVSLLYPEIHYSIRLMIPILSSYPLIEKLFQISVLVLNIKIF